MEKLYHFANSWSADSYRCSPIQVGEIIPGGSRLFEHNFEGKHRVVHIGVGKRILIVGVIGAFTPRCWNEHLFKVLANLDYYLERGVSSVCVIAPNDAYAMTAWRNYLGECPETVKLWGDVTTRFIRLLGMGMTYPRIFPGIRCRRFIIVADNLHVKQVMIAPDSGKELVKCLHVVPRPIPEGKTYRYRKLYIKEVPPKEPTNSASPAVGSIEYFQ